MPSVNVTSNYVGDVVDAILSLTVLGNQAVEKGSVHVEPGVQKELFIPRFNAAADQLQDRQEDPDAPSDSFTWDERSIAPLDLMFYDLVNPRNFEEVWRPFQPVGNLVDRVDNPRIQAAIISETMKSVGAQLGKIIWQGDTGAGGGSPLRFFDGFEKVIEDEAGSIKVTPAGVITEANIISILEAIDADIPDAIYEDASVIYNMPTSAFRLYQKASRALSFKGTDITDDEQGRFGGRTIRHYTGMSDDKIIVAKSTSDRQSNLWAAVDVANDPDVIKIERHRPESERFMVKVLFKYAVNVGNPSETVIYLPA